MARQRYDVVKPFDRLPSTPVMWDPMPSRLQHHGRLRQFQLFHNSGTVSLVEVSVKEGSVDLSRTERLVLKGPFCQTSRTLPSTFEFARSADGGWRTDVVDPCYWTPELPFRYSLQVVDADGRILEQADQIGLRRLESRGPNLWLDGRRWVFRGAEAVQLSDDELANCQGHCLGLIVDELAEHHVDTASRNGIPLILRVGAANIASRVREAARFAAVQMVILPVTWQGSRTDLATLAANLLFMTEVNRGFKKEIPNWADAVLCEEDEAFLGALCLHQPEKPVMTYSLLNETRLPNTGRLRSVCEQLQRRLAPRFDLSGYVVRSARDVDSDAGMNRVDPV